MPSDPAPPALSRRKLSFAGLIAAAVAATVVVMGITSRHAADAKLGEWTETQAVPVVAAALPDTHGQRATFDLPGRLEAYTQAQIYARVSGYLKDWKADIGTPVKAGQLLAEIDAPDLDQQIMQAQAALASAQANLTLAQATLQRGQTLIHSGAISKADLDQRAADAANKDGLVKAAQANLDRLRVLEQYKRITAPFDGLVTARSTDIGALINAGAAGAAAVRCLGHEETARLRQRPAELRAEHTNRHEGEYLGSRISGKDLSGDRAGVGASRRYRVRNDADAAHRRQCRRPIDDRRLCQCQF